MPKIAHTTVSHFLIGLFFLFITSEGKTHQTKSPITTLINIPVITKIIGGLEKPPDSINYLPYFAR